jgi:hypothetical protein
MLASRELIAKLTAGFVGGSGCATPALVKLCPVHIGQSVDRLHGQGASFEGPHLDSAGTKDTGPARRGLKVARQDRSPVIVGGIQGGRRLCQLGLGGRR